MAGIHLYTVVVDFYETQEVFIDQVRTTTTDLDQVLYAWVEQAVARGFIRGTKNPQHALRDIMDDDNTFLQVGPNIWEICFLVGKGMYTYSACESYYKKRVDKYIYVPPLVLCTLNLTLSSQDVTSSVFKNISVSLSVKGLLHTEKATHTNYQLEYTRLKSSANLDKAFNQKCKQLERKLLNWSRKKKFISQGYNRDTESSDKLVYTTIFYYVYHRSKNVETRVLQLPFIVGHDINYAFHNWATTTMYARWKPLPGQQMGEQILNNQDRKLLMEKFNSDYYVPVPIEDCVNVWGTHFSLSAGMAKLIMIKTVRDEVVQGQ